MLQQALWQLEFPIGLTVNNLIKLLLNTRVWELLIVILFIFNFTFPIFYLHLNTSGSLIIIMGSLIIVSAILFFKKKNYFYRNDILPYLFSLTLFLFPISMFFGLSVAGISINVTDLTDLYRPISIFSFYLIGILGASSLYINYHRLINLLFIILIIFGILQLSRNYDSISLLYTKQSNISNSRLSVPFLNPYDYGFTISFFVFYYWSRFLFDSKYYLTLFALGFLFVLLTQSRSVFVGLVLILTVATPFLIGTSRRIIFLQLHNSDIRYLYFTLILAFCTLFGIIFLIDQFPYLFGALVRVAQGGEFGGSYHIRIEQFNKVLTLVNENVILSLFGHGPAKEAFKNLETIYTYLLFRFGLIGIIIYFSILGVVFCRTIIVIKSSNPREVDFYIAYAFCFWLVFTPIVSLGNNFTEQIRISFLFYFLTGFVSGKYLSRINKIEN